MVGVVLANSNQYRRSADHVRPDSRRIAVPSDRNEGGVRRNVCSPFLRFPRPPFASRETAEAHSVPLTTDITSEKAGHESIPPSSWPRNHSATNGSPDFADYPLLNDLPRSCASPSSAVRTNNWNLCPRFHVRSPPKLCNDVTVPIRKFASAFSKDARPSTWFRLLGIPELQPRDEVKRGTIYARKDHCRRDLPAVRKRRQYGREIIFIA